MAVKDEVLSFVRNKVTALNPESKVIVAPTLVGIYVNKSKDVLLRNTLSHHWKFQHRGVLAFIYHPLLNRLKLTVVDERTGRENWQESFGDYTNYECIHQHFHILNSSRNFCQKIGIFFADEKVAKMVSDTMEVFSAQRRREQARKDHTGRLVARSRSFNSTERVQIDVKLTRSYSNSMGNIKVQRTALNVFESEAKKYATKQTSRRPSLRKMFSGLRSSFRVRIRRQETNEVDNGRSKRSRLSASYSEANDNPDVEINEPCNRLTPDSNNTSEEGELEILSSNWKLTDRELRELYRLSFFNKTSNVQSTDLCVTEL